MADSPHRVVESIISCGLDSEVLFEGDTQSKRIATKIFENNFNTCMNKTVGEPEEDL